MAARTDRTVKLARRAGRLACPTNKKQVYFTDADTEHLRLRVARSGRHGWEWRAHGRTVSLGRFCPKGEGGLDYYAARAETDRLNKAKRAGRDVRAAAFDPKQAVTVAEMLEAYLSGRRPDAATVANVRSQIAPLVREFGDMRVRDVTRGVVRSVYEQYHLTGPKERWRVPAARKVVTWYRAAFNFCQREGIIPPELPNFASSLINDDRRLRRSSKGYKVALTDDELRRLFLGFESAKAAWDGRSRQRADGPPVRHPMGFLLTGFLLFTGCRKGEARGLRVAEIVGHECVLAEHKTDADGKERRIVLGAEAQRVLAEAASWRGRMRYQGPLAFPGPGKNGRSGKLANPADHLRTAMRYGDLVMRLVLHSFRSIYVNYAIRVGVPLDVVQGNVGHANSRTTRKHYIELSAGLLRDGAERVNAGFAALRSSLGWEARPR